MAEVSKLPSQATKKASEKKRMIYRYFHHIQKKRGGSYTTEHDHSKQASREAWVPPLLRSLYYLSAMYTDYALPSEKQSTVCPS